LRVKKTKLTAFADAGFVGLELHLKVVVVHVFHHGVVNCVVDPMGDGGGAVTVVVRHVPWMRRSNSSKFCWATVAAFVARSMSVRMVIEQSDE
jgi:hypothetical protein